MSSALLCLFFDSQLLDSICCPVKKDEILAFLFQHILPQPLLSLSNLVMSRLLAEYLVLPLINLVVLGLNQGPVCAVALTELTISPALVVTVTMS
jgi:hypothetical protein